MIKVVLLTGSSLRHKYFSARFFNSKKINHICSFEEDNSVFHNDKKKKLIYKHETQRHKYEIKSFKKYLIKSKKFRAIKVKKGAINSSSNIDLIKKMKPDLIVSYGCSIINEKLIKKFRNRFLNIHLGLSPYYRGAGTNFFPFVKNELHFLGATLMFINKGVDTGKIIHQIRPEIYSRITLANVIFSQQSNINLFLFFILKKKKKRRDYFYSLYIRMNKYKIDQHVSLLSHNCYGNHRHDKFIRNSCACKQCC